MSILSISPALDEKLKMKNEAEEGGALKIQFCPELRKARTYSKIYAVTWLRITKGSCKHKYRYGAMEGR